MGNNFNGFGMNLPPNNNFSRNNYSTQNNINQNSFNTNTPQQTFTSLDGRKFETKDKMFIANQEYYRKMLNDSMKKGN